MRHPIANRRRGLTGLIAVVLALSMTLFGAAVGAGSASAARGPGKIITKAKHVKMTAPVRGTTAAGRPVRAVFIPKSFRHVGDELRVRGVLKGKIVRPGPDRKFRKAGVVMNVLRVDGHPVAAPTSARAAAFPPSPPAGACNVLNLVLGPLDLNVLGLQVSLNRVVLNIIAQTGAGQLLGNLLCFVAGLLDGGTPLSGLLDRVTSLLNRILGALGALRA